MLGVGMPVRRSALSLVAAGLMAGGSLLRWGGCDVAGIDASSACVAAQSSNYYATASAWSVAVMLAAVVLTGLALAHLARAFSSPLAPWIAGAWALGGATVAATALGWLDENLILVWLTLPFSLAWMAAPLLACVLIASSERTPRPASLIVVTATVLISPAGEAAALGLIAGRTFPDIAPWTGLPAAIGLLLIATSGIWLRHDAAPARQSRPLAAEAA